MVDYFIVILWNTKKTSKC